MTNKLYNTKQEALEAAQDFQGQLRGVTELKYSGGGHFSIYHSNEILIEFSFRYPEIPPKGTLVMSKDRTSIGFSTGVVEEGSLLAISSHKTRIGSISYLEDWITVKEPEEV